jgi:hypothetical protein
VGSCEHGNEPLDSIKGGEFLNMLSDSWLFMKDSAPRNLLDELFLKQHDNMSEFNYAPVSRVL